MPIKRQKQIEGSETQHYVSERKKRGQEQPKLQPPLTPMIDVTFQLLLYFVLTAQFREDEGQIPGSLPVQAGKQQESETPVKPVRINLQPYGEKYEFCRYEVDSQIFEGGTQAELEQFHVYLKGRKEHSDGKAPVFIRPRGDVKWKFVVEAFNAAVAAQFEYIGFANN
jgi:biopolymer transport protein ExbD